MQGIRRFLNRQSAQNVDLVRHTRRLTQGDAHTALALCPEPAARVVDQHLAHHARGERDEVIAVPHAATRTPGKA